jgi:SAM-dependent methyltransferase
MGHCTQPPSPTPKACSLTNEQQDMADQYPSATVTGTDLSPIQPEWVPPNCHFEIDDVSLEWTFPPDHFDFIHIRELFGCIPDWDFFFQQAYRHTKPGGWVEIVEHSVQPVADDDSMGPDHFYHTWGETVIDMGNKFGKSFTIWNESAERMRRAGFVDVVEVGYKWPMNGWPKNGRLKNIGRWNQLRLMDGVEGFMLRLLTQVGGVRLLPKIMIHDIFLHMELMKCSGPLQERKSISRRCAMS